MKAVNIERLLPADIPPGERVLWHGRPEWVGLARRAFRADVVGAYFLAMSIVNFALSGFEAGVLAGLIAAAKTIAAGFAALVLLSLLAWLSARTTLYVVTTKRLTLKIGVALPVFLNIPFSRIASASLALHADGEGDIPVALVEGEHIAYLHLWPHARPFRFRHPEPALRSIRNARAVADVLSAALAAAHPESRVEAAAPVDAFGDDRAASVPSRPAAA